MCDHHDGSNEHKFRFQYGELIVGPTHHSADALQQAVKPWALQLAGAEQIALVFLRSQLAAQRLVPMGYSWFTSVRFQ